MSNEQNSEKYIRILPHLEAIKNGDREDYVRDFISRYYSQKSFVMPRDCWTKVDNQQMRWTGCNKYKMTTFRHAPAHFTNRSYYNYTTLSFVPSCICTPTLLRLPFLIHCELSFALTNNDTLSLSLFYIGNTY